jgi:hypothetical protein
MLLSKTIFITISSAKFITTFFNINTREALYIIAIYKPPQMFLKKFTSIPKIVSKELSANCPIVIIENLNINMLTITLNNYTNIYNFKIHFFKNVQSLITYK